MSLLISFLFLFGAVSVASSRSIDALLIAGAFEGDILGVDPKQLNKIADAPMFWERNVVPFAIDSELDFIRRRAVEKAMLRIQDRTCIRFVARQREEDYLHFTDGTGCASHVGRVGGCQDIIVGPECDQVGLVLHLLMHALGFWHEESADDSSDYLLINWDNIREEDKIHFQTYSHRKSNHMSEPFDYRSLMYISPNAFAIDRDRPTILSKDERFVIGQRVGLSEGDVNKIVRRYCDRRQSTNDGVIDEDDPSDKGGRNLAGSDPIASRTPLALMGLHQTAKCLDASYKCPLWATQGHCYIRPTVMRRECQESCRVCQNDQECTNYNSLCGVWAWMGRCTGGAGSSARQVLTTCPLACGVCLPRSADDVLLSSDNSCQDRLLTCRRLARKGRCFYKHVLRLCPAACNSCNRRGTNGFDWRAPSTRAPSANSCRDTWSTLRCARWKNHGWCSRRNDSAMRHYCKLTCGFCSLRKGDSHSCEDINPLCQIIARHDMCGPMMKLQCARTCHVC